MNKKGFTLIEMLSVIMLLTLLSLLVVPSIVNYIKQYQNTTDSLSMTIIESGAELYINDFKDKYIRISGNNYCIDLNKLVELGYLKEPVKFDGEDITDLKTLKVSYDDEFKYELVDNGMCSSTLFCVPVEEDDLTTGTSPKKDSNGNLTYTPGDEYICEVAPDEKHRFFVLSTDEDKINLIMYSNIRSGGEPVIETNPTDEGITAWNSETNQGSSIYGPVTAMTYLHNATKHWTNVSPIDFSYMDREYQGITDTNTTVGYTSFKMINGVAKITQLSGDEVIIGSEKQPVRARLPIYSTDSSKTEITNKKSDNSNLFLYDYMYLHNNVQPHSVGGVYGYWTLSSHQNNAVKAKIISYGGTVFEGDLNANKFYGVRPVITITSKNIYY